MKVMADHSTLISLDSEDRSDLIRSIRSVSNFYEQTGAGSDDEEIEKFPGLSMAITILDQLRERLEHQR